VNHEYRQSYAYSVFGKNTSGIALAVNKTLDPASPDFKWIDKGLVFESKASDDFNAIDPNFIQDQHGHAWLAFGSFWDGIKMRRLDDATGLLSASDTTLYSLARRVRPSGANPAKPGLPPDWEAVEAPFIVQHHGYFYLFTSWDLCCRGTKSTYKTMVGRSKSVTGPYVDQAGKLLTEGGGTEFLVANSRWLGPGGESVLMDPKGQDLIVFHAYDAKTGKPSMQLSTLSWSGDWPHAALEP
jgi:arabinan endo-1,5-alpha-L-arabinosidase